MSNKNISEAKLKLLANLHEEPPRGLFRWLHNHYLFRYHEKEFGGQFSEILFGPWQGISDDPTPESGQKPLEDLWVKILNRNAWAAGIMGIRETVKTFWGDMTPLARGAYFAGASERSFNNLLAQDIVNRFSTITLTAESACQIACNAIINRQPETFRKILSCEQTLSARIERQSGLRKPIEIELGQLPLLSNKVVDLLLETALIAHQPEYTKLALGHGANPNLTVWQLERSYNKIHSGLDYALSMGYSAEARSLQDFGARQETENI